MDIVKLQREVLLSLLWVFLTVNFIFCDVFTLMHYKDLQQIITGTVDGMKLTEEFLFAFAVIMEIPMVMIVLSRLLPQILNRWLNIIAAAILALIQIGSLFTGSNSMHYIFFSSVEIVTALTIFVTAIRWNQNKMIEV